MKCEHCGSKDGVQKVTIASDDVVYLCGACRGDKRTSSWKQRDAKETPR